jgi:hypothetical protein
MRYLWKIGVMNTVEMALPSHVLAYKLIQRGEAAPCEMFAWKD